MTQVDLLLGIVAFGTSTVAGVFGMGGGLLLIAIMPSLVPPQQIVPLHGVTQFFSNLSRAWFSLPSVRWQFMWPFLCGSLLGVGLFATLLSQVSVEHIPLFIGSYILLTLWSDRVNRLLRRFETFFTAGLFQSGLGIVVGATGPLTTTLLSKKLTDKDQIVATNALFMLFSHLIKILLFGLMGFAYLEHYSTLLLMVLGAIGGSWAGSKLRGRLSNERFAWMLKLLLTLLALNMLWQASQLGWPFWT